MSQDEFGLRSLGQVLVPVRDLARAVTFYRDTLGMRLLFEVPRMAFFDLGGVRLMLGEPEENAPASGAILYYQVPDLSDAHAELRRRGVAFDMDPTLIADMEDQELWMAFFSDSEGNRLALMAEAAKG